MNLWHCLVVFTFRNSSWVTLALFADHIRKSCVCSQCLNPCFESGRFSLWFWEWGFSFNWGFFSVWIYNILYFLWALALWRYAFEAFLFFFSCDFRSFNRIDLLTSFEIGAHHWALTLLMCLCFTLDLCFWLLFYRVSIALRPSCCDKHCFPSVQFWYFIWSEQRHTTFIGFELTESLSEWKNWLSQDGISPW